MLTGSVIDVYTGSYLIITKTDIWTQNMSQRICICVSRQFFSYVTETATCTKRQPQNLRNKIHKSPNITYSNWKNEFR